MINQQLNILLLSSDKDLLDYVRQVGEAADGPVNVHHAYSLKGLFAANSHISPDLILLDEDHVASYEQKQVAITIASINILAPVVLLRSDRFLQEKNYGVDTTISRKQLNAAALPKLFLNASLCRHRKISKNPQRHPTAQLRNIINNMADGVVIVDEEGILKFMNPTAEKMFGRNQQEMIGEMFGFPLVANETTEINIFNPMREEIVVELRTSVINWDDEPAHLATLRDITGRKRAEVVERTAESLECVRLLAGAIAHEFAQPLQILHHLFAIMEMEDGASVRLAKCKRNAERISNLLRQLRNVVVIERQGYLNGEILDLAASSSLDGQDVFEAISSKLDLSKSAKDHAMENRILFQGVEKLQKLSRRKVDMLDSSAVELQDTAQSNTETPMSSKDLFTKYLRDNKPSEEDIDQIFAQAQRSIMLVDSDGYIQRLNEPTEAIFDRSADELQGFFLGMVSANDSTVPLQIVRRNGEVKTVLAEAVEFHLGQDHMTLLVLEENAA